MIILKNQFLFLPSLEIHLNFQLRPTEPVNSIASHIPTLKEVGRMAIDIEK